MVRPTGSESGGDWISHRCFGTIHGNDEEGDLGVGLKAIWDQDMTWDDRQNQDPSWSSAKARIDDGGWHHSFITFWSSFFLIGKIAANTISIFITLAPMNMKDRSVKVYQVNSFYIGTGSESSRCDPSRDSYRK